MSEHDMVQARRLPDGSFVQVMPDGTTQPLEDRTDWTRLAAMTEEEIEANALADPDNPPLTPDELARMRRVPDPAAIRARLGLTQEQFAAQFGLSLSDLREWEQRQRWIDTNSITLLRIIERDPDIVRAVLTQSVDSSLRPTGD